MTPENPINLYREANDSRLSKGDSLEKLLDMKISPSRFQSILIELAQKIVREDNIERFLQRDKENRFTKPCTLPQREIIRLEKMMYENVSESYSDIELSPLAPLGINSLLTKVSQRTVLSTVRNVEVLADPTTTLSLECLNRLRQKNTHKDEDNSSINLSTSTRCTRGQLFSKESGFVSHFKVFALASGSNYKNEIIKNKLFEHLGFYLDFFDEANDTGRYSVKNINVKFSDINIIERLITNIDLDRRELGRHSQDNRFDTFKANNIELPSVVAELDSLDRGITKKYGLERYVRELEESSVQIDKLTQKHSNVDFEFDLARNAGMGYYNGICIKVTAGNSRGQEFPLVDGGYSDWLAKLTTNNKATFCSSGFGLELFGKHFKA